MLRASLCFAGYRNCAQLYGIDNTTMDGFTPDCNSVQLTNAVTQTQTHRGYSLADSSMLLAYRCTDALKSAY